MQINVLASGSHGNGYIISNGEDMVLIEIGIPWKQIQRKLAFKTSSIRFALVSHSHRDHSGHVKEAIRAGIDVYGLQSTFDVLGLSGHRTHVTAAHEQFQIGPWNILPFDVEHDVEALGFLIGNGDDRLLYLTDTPFTKYRFAGLSSIMIECNNIAEILSKNILEGYIPTIVGKRVRRNHFNLENLKAFLLANDLSRCREIWLLHLSNGNSDERRMIKEIQEKTGIPVRIAEET